MRIDYPESSTPKTRLTSLLSIFETLQDEVAMLSDELDTDTLEDAEAAIDVVIDKLGDVIEENGWEVE